MLVDTCLLHSRILSVDFVKILVLMDSRQTTLQRATAATRLYIGGIDKQLTCYGAERTQKC